MLDTGLSEVGIGRADGVDYVEAGDPQNLLPHLQWQLHQVMSRVRPVDLSAAEIAALLDILGPAHSRVIGGPTARPPLRVLGRSGENAAPDFAQ